MTTILNIASKAAPEPVVSKPHTCNISVASCTVTDLFSGMILGTNISGQLTIPEYQRPYIWQKKELIQLTKDLREYFNELNEKSPLYYLGSIILHLDGNKLNIIDGQQRLTTLAILQSCIRPDQVPKICYSHPISLQNIKNNYAIMKAIADDYTGFSDFDPSQINVTLIVTESEDDAYTFFETQNTGGVRLTGVDIIKAHHLRALSNERFRSYYAKIWEDQKELKRVVSYLIKARKWGFLQWKEVPSYRNFKETKDLIIKEFSQKTLLKGNTGFQMVAYNNHTDGTDLNLSPYKYAIRQPLANGQNFIEYLESFCGLHERLFIKSWDREIDDEFYSFQTSIINKIDGTVYLKEFYETAMLCYAHRFGTEKLVEAAFWIFRYAYSLRISNEKTVREDSIPAFLKKSNYLLDHILMCFTHEQLMGRLQSFPYDVSSQNCDPNKVKGRFVDKVENYFKFKATKKKENNEWIITEYDRLLQKAINDRLSAKK